MEFKFKLIDLDKSSNNLKDLLLVIEKGNILNPHFSIKDLEDIFVWSPFKRLALDPLDFEGLLEYHDNLSNT